MALQNISTWPYNPSIYKVVEIHVIYQSCLCTTHFSVQEVTSKVVYLYISPVPHDKCCLKSSSTIPNIGASTSKTSHPRWLAHCLLAPLVEMRWRLYNERSLGPINYMHQSITQTSHHMNQSTT